MYVYMYNKYVCGFVNFCKGIFKTDRQQDTNSLDAQVFYFIFKL